MKNNKGITLIALIITILIILILAAIIIKTSNDSNIILQAQKATEEYSKKQKEESNINIDISKYLSDGYWEMQSDNKTIKHTKTNETTKIGDTYTNEEVLLATGGTQSNYTDTWTVIGVENGKLKLISTTNVKDNIYLGYNDENVYYKDSNGIIRLREEIVEVFNKKDTSNLNVEKAIWSYQHVEESLNNYAKESTGILSARSVTLKDLEAKELLNMTNEKRLGFTELYGSQYHYFYDNDKEQLFCSVKETGTNYWTDPYGLIETSLLLLDNKENIFILDSKDDELILEDTSYNVYYFSTEEKNQFSDFLANTDYWIPTKAISCQTSCAQYQIFAMFQSTKSIHGEAFFDSWGQIWIDEHGVRAIVLI